MVINKGQHRATGFENNKKTPHKQTNNNQPITSLETTATSGWWVGEGFVEP